MGDRLLDTLEAFHNAQTVPELWNALEVGLKAMDCDTFGYRGCFLPGKGSEIVYKTNFDPNWVAHYLAMHFGDIDPTVLMARQSYLPRRWDNIKDVAASNERQTAFMNEAGEFGLRHGLTVPIHGRDGEFAALSLVADIPEGKSPGHYEQYKHHAHLLGLSLPAALVRLINDSEAPEAPKLTLRQQECLAWTARGKTGWEIGEILGIAESTVVYHLQEAATRLGVFGKHHAAIRAISLRLVVP